MFVKHSPSCGGKGDYPVAVGNYFTEIFEFAASEKQNIFEDLYGFIWSMTFVTSVPA